MAFLSAIASGGEYMGIQEKSDNGRPRLNGGQLPLKSAKFSEPSVLMRSIHCGGQIVPLSVARLPGVHSLDILCTSFRRPQEEHPSAVPLQRYLFSVLMPPQERYLCRCG